MPIITMSYGASGLLVPVPLMNLNKTYNKTGDGTLVGTVFTAQLNGTLYAPTGGLAAIIALQDNIREIFNVNGKLFEVTCDGSPLISAYPRVNGPVFQEGNWVQTCPYTVELEWDDEPGTATPLVGAASGEFSGLIPPYIADAQESWAIEIIEDKAKYSLDLSSGTDTNPYQLRVTHNVSAIGKKHYTGAGLEMEAWQQAKVYVDNKIGWDGAFPGYSGVFNLDTSSFAPFNHVRSNNIDETGGSYAVSESWIAISPSGGGGSGRAIEDFTVEVRKGIDSDLTTVSIQGQIQGLESRTYGTGTNVGAFAITETKYAAASGYWNSIKDSARIYPRVQLFGTGSTRPINIAHTSKVVGHNPSNGIITYSYEYNDRPSNCIANSLTESITISDSNPTEVFAEIGIPGRSAGPILQDMGTITSAKREVSIEVVMAPASGCGNIAALMVNNPRNDAITVANWVYSGLTASYSQVFKHLDNETWDVKTGRYTLQRGWTYENGC